MKTVAILLLTIFTSLLSQAQAPAANFRSGTATGCAPLIVRFEDASTGNPVSWAWDFGNGATSTLRNPSTTYLQSGSYTVTLTVTNAGGVSNTVQRIAYVVVSDNPAASFSGDVLAGCSPLRTQFNDASLPDTGNRITAWEWDFGDGSLGLGANPQHTYSNTGQYTVTLKVTDDKGCAGVLRQPAYIQVSGGVTAAFTNPQPTACKAPAAVSFTSQSTGPGTLSYTWLFGDGGTANVANPTYTFATNDTFDVTLIVRSSLGCVDSITRAGAVRLGGHTTDFVLEKAACPGVEAQLLNASQPTPSASQWLFSNGAVSYDFNAKHIFTSPGNASVRLINYYGGCSDTAIKDVIISAPPQIAFTATDTVGCNAGLTTTFQNSTTAASFAWDFGDGATATETSPTHTYANLGVYNVTLKATTADGCMATLTKPAFIRMQKPAIRFNRLPARACVPLLFEPDVTITSYDSVTAYQWDFGDGQTGIGRTPQHNYTTEGVYTLRLTITTASGCTIMDSSVNAVRVGTKPQADFSVATTNTCASTAVQFTNLTDPADEYIWQFGDGGISYAQNPAYYYKDTGSQHVQLIVFNKGCADTVVKQALVYIQPSITLFQYQPNCSDKLQFTFRDSSIAAQTWQWNFGDGSPVFNGPNPPAHTFPAEGIYNVSLTTTNGSCSYTATQPVKVGRANVDFVSDNPVACKPARPLLRPTGDLSSVRELRWTLARPGLADTTIVSGNAGLQPLLTAAGYYDVTMIAVNRFGCLTDTVFKPAYLRVNGPTAAFNTPDTLICRGATATFQDQSLTDGRNALVKWEWLYGTSLTDEVYTAPPFTHVYDTVGTFSVRLRVTDSAGCTDVLSRPALINASSITVQWDGPEQTCPGSPSTFRNLTQATNISSVWNFGDGTIVTRPSPDHTYTDTGYYTVTLTVTSSAGCIDSLTRSNIYVGLPKADFDANTFVTYCTPHEAQFYNKSVYTTSVAWNLGQGTSTVANPVAYYTAKGEYDITLVATSPGGCTDTATKRLSIKAVEESNIRYVSQRGCQPVTVAMEAFDSLQGRFIWDFGDGIIADTTVNRISHQYNSFGSFVPSVLLYDPSGCVLILSGQDSITAIGVEARFGLNNTLFCNTGELAAQDSSIANEPFTHQWSFGDGGSASITNPVHQYAVPGQYNVQLIATTASGCADTSATALVRVESDPVIAITGDSLVCMMSSENYSGVSQNMDATSLSWQWSLPGGGTATGQNIGPILFANSGTAQLQVTATSVDGCSGTAQLPVTVLPLPGINVPERVITIQAGQSIPLPLTYNASVNQYTWSPAKGLSCTACPQPVASPVANTIYTVTATDVNGCSSRADVRFIVLCGGINVFAPNTFSPNGDGRNDVFYLRGSGLARVKSLRIFNRWGQVVFERREVAVNDAGQGWDGRHNGRSPLPGVYVFQAEVYCANGELLKLDGNIALIQ